MIYQKNVGAQVAIDFTLNKYLALMAIEKFEIMGAILELSTKQQCQLDQFGLILR